MSDINPMAWISQGLGGALQAGASIYQANKNYESQQQTNAMQIDLANNAITRRQADLQRAGINPLMAGKIGGAETPTLQAPKIQGYDHAAGAIGEIPRKAQEMQQTAMQIEQIKADTENKKEDTNLKLVEQLLKQADTKYRITEESLLKPQAETKMKLEGEQTNEAIARTAESQARTLTENLMRDPKYKLAINEATSAEWKAKADQYLPTIAKAQAAQQTVKAKWAEAIGQAEAQKADALAKIEVNNLVKSGAIVDTEIARTRVELSLLTSRAGIELIAEQLAKATQGANATKPYIDNIVKIIQGASIVKDMLTNQNTTINKSWNYYNNN